MNFLSKNHQLLHAHKCFKVRNMLLKLIVFSVLGAVVSAKDCYWNKQCPYQMFSIGTPYDSVRGDIRDHPSLNNCEAVSVWSIHRHGNRIPGIRLLNKMNPLQVKLKKEIIRSDAENRCSLCAQDIEDILNFEWNIKIDDASSLTQVGYEEVYSIGKRIREKYSKLILGSTDRYYFRSTKDKRSISSLDAFVQGLTNGTERNLSSCIDKPRAQDDVILFYKYCDRYLELVQEGPQLSEELAAYDKSPEYLAVRDRLLERLGMTYQLSLTEVFDIYELCRFCRTLNSNLRCPWCSLFTDEDLLVLEYRDDVRHYYKNGYASSINANLGGTILKDLYENFDAATRGEGKYIVSYFTHTTVLEMVYSALGLYKDSTPLRGSTMNRSRLWRTSYISSFSTNFIAILNRCESDSYRVQLLINEEVTSICPDEGCTWQEFLDIFQSFSNSTFSFCYEEQTSPEKLIITNNLAVSRLPSNLLIFVSMLRILYSFLLYR